MQVTAAQFARRVGVSRALISQLTKAGVLKREGKNYDLAVNLDAWKQYENEKQQGQKNATANDSLRARLLQEKIRAAKLKNDESERHLVSLASVRRIVTEAFHGVKSKMLALPSQVAPLVVGIQPAEAEKILRDRITRALKELSEHEWVTPQKQK